MLKILHPASHPAARAYIHTVLIKDFLALEFEATPSVSAHYAIKHVSDGYAKEIYVPDVFFSKEELSIPELPLQHWNLPARLKLNSKLSETSSLPVIFGSGETKDRFNIDSNSISLPIDIFGSAFFMLSRYEEVVSNSLDNHQRYPASESIAYKEGFLEQPIIDQYVELLWLAINKLWPSIQRKVRKGETRITCDVDAPYNPCYKNSVSMVKTLTGDLIKRRSPGQLISTLKDINKTIKGAYKDPYDTFDWYMDTCKKYGHKAAFYFIADHSGGKIDGCYSLEEPKIKQLLKNIADRGHEIGLHGSYNTFNNPAQLTKERSQLLKACEQLGIDTKIEGNRQHFLRWDTVQTPDHLEAAGFQYDTTGSFADRPGFRYGTAKPFRMWSWQKKGPLNLIQKPLVVMECSVIAERYLHLGYTQKAIDKILQLKESSLKYGGDFTLLWHNSNFMNQQDFDFFESTQKMCELT